MTKAEKYLLDEKGTIATELCDSCQGLLERDPNWDTQLKIAYTCAFCGSVYLRDRREGEC